MSMVKGQAHTDPVTGLAGRIFDNMTAASDAGFAAGATTVGSAVRNAIAALCESIASAVVDELQANATVTTTITTATAGLQRDNTAGNPDTLAPSANRDLVGSVS